MKNFILDVDGVITTGQFFYNKEGKKFKVFGPDDNDALQVLKNVININFVTADSKGYDISHKRIVKDMGFELNLVKQLDRSEWIQKNYQTNQTIYMGDGILDYLVMQVVEYSIAPNNAHVNAKNASNFITNCKAGERAVAEACIHIADKFFKTNNPFILK